MTTREKVDEALVDRESAREMLCNLECCHTGSEDPIKQQILDGYHSILRACLQEKGRLEIIL